MITIEEAKRDPQINKNLNDPSKKIIVKLRSTGKLVAIDRIKDFKPGYHEKWEPKKETKPVEKVVVESSVDEDKKLWKSLKAKGWTNLDNEERKAYKTLKKKFE